MVSLMAAFRVGASLVVRGGGRCVPGRVGFVVRLSSAAGEAAGAAPPRARAARLPKATGKLRQLPHAPKAAELALRAKRRGAKVAVDENEKNLKRRAAKRSAAAADEMGQAVSVPLRQVIEAHSPEALRRSLHAFEHATATLTAAARVRSGARPLDDILGDLKALRLGVLEAAKAGAREAKAAETARDAAAASDGVLEAIEALLDERGHCLEELRNAQRAFRRVPTVSLRTPTAVLVGAPNVGKSTLVRTLSTGEPEVGNYAFTTRGVSLGHVYRDGDAKDKKKLLGQIMDTPGLLRRDDVADRNEMEQLTMATMNHLPSAVIFVLDLTGHAGDAKSSPEDQLAVRDALKAKFPRRPWVDVVSKADLYDPKTCLPAPDGALFVSAKDSHGIADLEARVTDVLAIVAKVLERQKDMAAAAAAAGPP